MKTNVTGGQRIAVRVNGVVRWLATDHLGSTALTADGATGARIAELRYKPWGESRYSFGATPTARLSVRLSSRRSLAEVAAPLHRAGAGQCGRRVVFLQRQVLRPCAGAVRQCGYDRAAAEESAESESVQLCAE